MRAAWYVCVWAGEAQVGMQAPASMRCAGRGGIGRPVLCALRAGGGRVGGRQAQPQARCAGCSVRRGLARVLCRALLRFELHVTRVERTIRRRSSAALLLSACLPGL